MKIIATKIMELRDIQLETKESSWTLSYSTKIGKWVVRFANNSVKFESFNLPDCINEATKYIKENRSRLPYSINYQL